MMVIDGYTLLRMVMDDVVVCLIAVVAALLPLWLSSSSSVHWQPKMRIHDESLVLPQTHQYWDVSYLLKRRSIVLDATCFYLLYHGTFLDSNRNVVLMIVGLVLLSYSYSLICCLYYWQ